MCRVRAEWGRWGQKTPFSNRIIIFWAQSDTPLQPDSPPGIRRIYDYKYYLLLYLLYQNDIYVLFHSVVLLSCCCFLSEVLDGSSYGHVIKYPLNLVIYFFSLFIIISLTSLLLDIIITFQASSHGWQECWS